MSLPVVLLPLARSEFDQATDWYERQQPGLGTDFVAQINSALNRLARSPEQHPFVAQDVRPVMARRFPYAILYKIEPSRIVVFAVFHSRRDPAEWQRRL